eukprot:129302-Hanusia_phi.AAC.1
MFAKIKSDPSACRSVHPTNPAELSSCLGEPRSTRRSIYGTPSPIRLGVCPIATRYSPRNASA